MAEENSTQLADRVIDEVARWPEVSLVTPVQARTILDGIVLANHADLQAPGRVRKHNVDVLAQAMGLPSWAPEDNAPVVIARVDGMHRLENGQHRLAAVASLPDAVRLMVRRKDYETTGAYRTSLAAHDAAAVPRGYAVQAAAAGMPIPRLGRQHAGGTGGGWTPMAAGAWAVFEEFGANPLGEPKTLDTWKRIPWVLLRNEMMQLSEASKKSGCWGGAGGYGSALRRIEAKVFSARCAGLWLEFFRVDVDAGREFLGRLMGQGGSLTRFPNCTVRAISEWVLAESAKPPREQLPWAWTYTLPRRLINAWAAHRTGRASAARVVRKGRVKIHGSRLVWWPGSDDKPESETS